MQMRRINEATIGAMALGKAAELGRQLVLATDKKFASKMAQKSGGNIKPETLQEWANGYIAFDAVISIMGVLAMLQGMRKNRKGAGQAALVQGGTIIGYSVYYLLYSLFGLSGAKASVRFTNVVLSLAHGAGGILIFRFAQRAVK